MQTNIKLIGLIGPKGVGKTTFAHELGINFHHSVDTVVLSFAEPLIAMAIAMGIYSEAVRDQTLRTQTISKLGKTPEEILKTLDSEWGRKLVHEDIWLWAMQQQLDQHNKDDEDSLVIIDDCELEEEVQWILDKGGVVFALSREGYPGNTDNDTEKQYSKQVQALVYQAQIDTQGLPRTIKETIQVINHKLDTTC